MPAAIFQIPNADRFALRFRRHKRLRAVRYQQLHVPWLRLASDAIADFVRGLDRADSVAVYTFSRNLTRAAAT